MIWMRTVWKKGVFITYVLFQYHNTESGIYKFMAPKLQEYIRNQK